MCYLSPLACFVIAFLVNISTAQKTLESIHNELHITNFISCKPISIRLLIDTYRPSKVNLQAKLRLFIILLKMSLSFWIVFSTMVDQDVSTKPGPIMAIAKNHLRLYSKDEHEKNNPISKIATTSTCSSKPEQHCILSDVVQRQDEKEEEDKKVCYSRREFVTGEAKQCIKCSFLYDQFYRPSNHSYRSFQTFPAIPIRENEELNQEIPYFRLGNTRAVLDGNPAESGYAHNQTINLSNHRRRNLERIGSETNDGFNSLMASTPSSGFNSLTVYDPGALVTSNRRNDFQLMSTVSNRRPTISSSGYESGRGIRHVISGSFTFSLGLQVERDTNEEPNNQVNYPIQQDEPEHLSDLMPSISAGVSAELSCIESEHENPEGNEAVNNNIQISEICPSVDLFLPESPRPVLRTVRDHDLLACANQQENERETLLATVVSLHMTELKETESSGSSQSSMQASRNISLQAVSQTSVSPHYIPILDINLDLESSRQTGGENAIHLMIPVSTTDNQATGNTNESTEISASQTQSAIQPVSSSSGRINEHAHRNGNYYGSYNRLQNNQCVDDALFGDGQDTNTDKDTVDHCDLLV